MSLAATPVRQTTQLNEKQHQDRPKLLQFPTVSLMHGMKTYKEGTKQKDKQAVSGNQSSLRRLDAFPFSEPTDLN